MKKIDLIAVGLFLLTLIMTAVSLFLLPDKVITQLSFENDNVTVMPKVGAIAIPFCLGVIGSAMTYFSKGDTRTKIKTLIISAVGIVVFILMLIVNLAF